MQGSLFPDASPTPEDAPSATSTSTSTPQRHFLGWDTPLVPAAARWLQRYSSGQTLDLSGVTIVLPTLRAVRQLELRLDSVADASGGNWTAGWIGTVGSLPEQLYDLSDVFDKPVRRIDDLQRTLFWARVLRQTPPEDLRRLIGRLPGDDASSSWMAIATTIDRLAADLAAADVSPAKIAEHFDAGGERSRWQTLASLFDRYRESLLDAGRVDVDLARRRAIDDDRCRSDREVVLIGCTDLSATATQMIGRLDAPVHALVAGPQSAADRFDAFGNVSRRDWANVTIDLPDDTLIAAGEMTDQSETAVAILDRLRREEEVPPGSVTIGATDESQIEPIELSMAGRGWPTVRNAGYRIAATAPGRLIRLLAAHVDSRTYRTLAALVRHPDVLARLPAVAGVSDAESYLVKLDQFRSETYTVSTGSTPPPGDGKRADYGDVVAITAAIERWIEPLCEPQWSLSRRCQRMSRWLSDVFAYRDDDHTLHPRTVSATEAIERWLGEQTNLDPAVDPVISPSAMMDLVVSATESLRIADESEGDVSQDVGPATPTPILGWLDLAFDDSPAMVVVGLNHPFVPEAVTADAFLPGNLRERFGIADNARRFARDAHALQCIVASRPHVHLIVGRSSADGSPTPPSRLIAAAGADTVAERVRRLLGDAPEIARPPHRWDDAGPVVLGDEAMRRPDLTRLPPAAVDVMSVTSFKNYLNCPYRFYLRHVLHLKPMDDAAGELAANQFGDLVHNSLEIWGEGSGKDETHPDRIDQAMQDAVSDYVAKFYGPSTTAAVQLQIHQARQKIRRVARVQAERIAAGWIVDRVEAAVNQDVASIRVGDVRMGLRGRFDRIDFHPSTGRYAILDYKTHGHKPEKKHIENDRWVDLQLPLYRRMVPFLGIDADPREVQVGYFNIADKDADTRINLAEFTDAQWAEADRLIDQIVLEIASEKFDPADEPPMFDDYDMILQEGTHR